MPLLTEGGDSSWWLAGLFALLCLLTEASSGYVCLESSEVS